MPTRITSTQLSRNLSDVLNRVRYRGETFIVERKGEPVAKITGPPKEATLADLVEIILRHSPLDDKWADDLEAARKAQTPPTIPEWPS